MKRAILVPLLLALHLTGIAQATFKLVPPNKTFEIIFPGEPRHQHTESGPIVADSFSYASSGTRFILTFFKTMPPVPEGVNAEGSLRASIDGTVGNAGGKLISEESLMVKGHPARKVKISRGEQTVIDGRFVYADACVYQLLVMHRRGEEPIFERQFFDSFTLPK